MKGYPIQCKEGIFPNSAGDGAKCGDFGLKLPHNPYNKVLSLLYEAMDNYFTGPYALAPTFCVN